ncbi:tetratricopeptide repeat protein [Sediminibacterium sp.]|uniref:tetratricopeptide repeat protein n=1 Tax=Sediminibacterium sp. TaxID=1917865 RepID=UPI0027328303|nr:tetratricopeptide repeat protein [Sediminibacterium sp.]MDP3393828.1 tetratricopeptide repeat protein [Sediminibacterium sp.]MDP3568842.1 tetratricopeptide repeat protein [Sediminibacterium sp.]
MYKIVAFIILTFFGFFTSVHSQETMEWSDADAAFKSAKQLYQQDQFSLAFPVFKRLYNNGIKKSNMPVQLMADAQYYYIICGLQLDEIGAADLAKTFVELDNHLAHVQMVSFYLGEYYYQQKEYNKALTYYAKSNIVNLNNRQIATMKFHQGYAYFINQDFENAKPLFNTIRQMPADPNYIDANYYYGFLAFSEKSYETAIECFLIAETHPDYQHVVPFYLTELYYFSGNREKALTYGESAIKRNGQYYDLQLKQLVGHLLFEKREFARALPYLETYIASSEKVRREDLYELSYCYYEAKNWNKAIQGFKQIGGALDSLEQNSMYLLADAYLKVNDLQNARNAFQFCAANNSNRVQKEVSSFHYAKLSYELGYFDIAVKSFQQFVAQYPQSGYVNESKELLISTLANTNSFKDALSLFESLPNKSANATALLPRLLYGRTVELINDQQLDAAEILLDKILMTPNNTPQLPLVYFWKGELSYRSGKMDDAIQFLTQYLKAPIRNGEVNPSNARYNLAYAYLKKEMYKQAKEQYELVNKNPHSALNNVEKDAVIRAADCWFMLKEYKQALNLYDQIVQLNWISADYATYQKAIIAGATNNQAQKLTLLQSIPQLYPTSIMLAQSRLEIANTYLADEAFEKVIDPLEALLNQKDAAALYPVAYQKLGIAYFNLNKNDESLSQFKQLVSKYPNSTESDAAVEYIRNIFIEQQQPLAYIQFMETNGKTIAGNEADSITYKSASIRFELKDNQGAEAGFSTYLANFPQGKYAVEANYFLAEINLLQKKNSEALKYYKAVAALSPNKYAERSTLQAGRIYYFDLQDYNNASTYYALLKTIALQQENKLEAMRGLLRCQYKTQQFAQAAPNAAELLLQKSIATDDRVMAGFVIAKNDQMDKKYPQALQGFQSLLPLGKSEITAESQYRVGELLLQLGKLDEAEKACFEVIKKYGSYTFWVTKSYLLVGDIYLNQKDYFNAEATFKSVADNAELEELKKEAAAKLALVIAEKEKNNKVQ